MPVGKSTAAFTSRAHRTGIISRGRYRGITTFEANVRAAERSQRLAHEQAMEQRREAFERYTGFITPYLEQFVSGDGGGARGVEYTEAEQAGLGAVTSAIEQRGEERIGKVRSALARRGSFRGGVGIAAEATAIGETEAGVAVARGEFAESAASRRMKERIARQQAYASILGSVGQGF